jgi:hypothetical protein
LIALIKFGAAYELLTMQSPPVSRHFLPLRSKYSPQCPALKHALCPSLSGRDEVSRPYTTIGKIMPPNNNKGKDEGKEMFSLR